MLEALWSVEFVSNMQSFGAGVAVLETGRIFGGDSTYFYVGSYDLVNGMVHAEVTVTHYAGERNSIFGPHDKFSIVATGKPETNVFKMDGHVKENPSMKIAARLTRRAELP